MTCPQRGDRIGSEASHRCGSRTVQVAIYGCALHDRCTLDSHGIRGAVSCVACPDNPDFKDDADE